VHRTGAGKGKLRAHMDQLRLAVLLPHLGVYGGIRRFFELGRVWSTRGHDVALAVPPEAKGAEPWLPVPGRILDFEALRRERWHAVITPDPKLFQEYRAEDSLRVFYAVLEKAPGAEGAWRDADLVLANSTGMVRHLAKRGVRAVAAVGGVNGDLFHVPATDSRAARAREGGPVRALVYGRLSRKRKGSWTAARAVAMAARRARSRVELILFDAPPPGEPPPEALSLPIPNRWVLRPSQEELSALYGDSDLFVSAERRAGWCNTAAEAMACGAAVVCTESGTEDFAFHGETALVSRFPWAWSLARYVETLLRDPPLRTRIAARGRDRIASFPWERTADTIEAAIRERLRT